jgi:hypothetical protein
MQRLPWWCTGSTLVAEPLSDAYLLECEMRARKFSGAFTGTSGTLAADVLRLLAELSRVKGRLAVTIAQRDELPSLSHIRGD